MLIILLYSSYFQKYFVQMKLFSLHIYYSYKIELHNIS